MSDHSYYRHKQCLQVLDDVALEIPRVKWLRHHNAREPFGRVLEIGCRDGHHTRFLLWYHTFSVLHGVDICKQAIKLAKKQAKGKLNGKSATYFQGAFEDFVSQEQYDVIICFNFLDKLDNKQAGFLRAKIERFLKPNGRVFLTVPHVNGQYGRDAEDPLVKSYFNEEKLTKWVMQLPMVWGLDVHQHPESDLIRCFWRKPEEVLR